MTKDRNISRTEGKVAVPRAPASVHHALRTPGIPLDKETREAMEPHFKHDFGKVRVHADGASAESARAVRAAAYTVGNDVVFGAERYAPRSERGQKLIAHELTHVVQQSRSTNSTAGESLTIGASNSPAEFEAYRGETNLSPAPRSLQRAPADDDWSRLYGDRKFDKDKTPAEFKASAEEIKPTTETTPGKTPAGPEITIDILKEIYPNVRRDAAAGRVSEDQIAMYCRALNTAFRFAKIDTVEAQAFYLAHAYIESDQFRRLTEGAQKDLFWDTTAKSPGKTTYSKTNEMHINDFGEEEFIGRGPVQVTGRKNYMETILFLEKAAEDYRKQYEAIKAKLGHDVDVPFGEFWDALMFANLAEKAAKAIRADPQQASNPEFSFLFSAAFLKKGHADRSAGGAVTGKDAVGGGDFAAGSPQENALATKNQQYGLIYTVLRREAKNAGVTKIDYGKPEKAKKQPTPQ